MPSKLTLDRFEKFFPNDSACVAEIIKIRYASDLLCQTCQRVTRHYRLKDRTVLSCKFCRSQTSVLKGTLFEKSSTPLKTWFLALYLMTQLRGRVSAKILQKELGVTYKTAWRMKKSIYELMLLNKGNLLTDTQVSKWVIFNTIELKVVRKS